MPVWPIFISLKALNLKVSTRLTYNSKVSGIASPGTVRYLSASNVAFNPQCPQDRPSFGDHGGEGLHSQQQRGGDRQILGLTGQTTSPNQQAPGPNERWDLVSKNKGGCLLRNCTESFPLDLTNTCKHVHTHDHT